MKFLTQKIPVSAEKLENGQLRVFYKDANGDSTIESDDFDTVLIATGRYPDTKALGCDSKTLNCRIRDEIGQSRQNYSR